MPVRCSNGKCDTSRLSLTDFKYIVSPMITFSVVVIFFSLIFCLSSVYCKLHSIRKILVKQMEDKMEHEKTMKDSEDAEREATIGAQNMRIASTNTIDNLRRNHLVTNKTVAFQAVSYVAAFLVTVIVPVIRLLIQDKSSTNGILVRAHFFLQPLQGFFNMLIFIGFKVHHLKNSNPSEPYSKLFYWIFFQSTSDPIFISRMTIVQQRGNSGNDDERNREILFEGEVQNTQDVGSLGNLNFDSSYDHSNLQFESELFCFDSEQSKNELKLDTQSINI